MDTNYMALPLPRDEKNHESEQQLNAIKGRETTDNLHKQSKDKFQERLYFNFADFQAFQVPKGWNKLFISINYVESGETITKSGKASVQNGQCHWEGFVLESIWISEYFLKANEGCLLKFVVAMGSTRFGTLGEATINLASHVGSETSTASLPMENCDHGTILQVKIQCLSPRGKIRDEHWKDANSYLEEMNVDYDDLDNSSDVSDNTVSRSIGTSHCNQLDNTYDPGELSSKDTDLLASFSNHNFDSSEGSFSFGIQNSPQHSNIEGSKNNMHREKNGIFSKNDWPPSYDTSRLNYLSSTSALSSSGMQLQDQIEDCRQVLHADSSKDLLDAGEVTVELLHAEAKMWEKNARKLMIDVERLQKELHNQSKNKRDLEMEISASRKESNGLKEEIKQLKTFLKESMVKQNDSKSIKFRDEEMVNTIKESQVEIKYQKGLDDDLGVQLKETQESNSDLVSTLGKLEETAKKQKMEIFDLSMTKFQFQDTECYSHGHEDSDEEEFNSSKEVLREKRKESCDSDLDLYSAGYPIKCLHEEIEVQEFRNLELQHQQLQKKQKNMESTIQFLEKTLAEKDQERQIERGFVALTSEEYEAKWRNRLAEKEKQIINLEKKLSEGVDAFGKETRALVQKVQELEADFSEKLGESRKDLNISGPPSSNFLLLECSNTNVLSTSEMEVNTLKMQISMLEEELNMNGLIKDVVVIYLLAQCIDIDNMHLDLELQLQAWKDNSAYLEGELHRTRANLGVKELENAALKEKLRCHSVEEIDSCSHLSAFPAKFKELARAILSTIIQLKMLFETHSTAIEEIQSQDEKVREIIRDANEFQSDLKDSMLKGNIICISRQELKNLTAQLVSVINAPSENQQDNYAETNKLMTDNLPKKEEDMGLRCSKKELETQANNLQNMKLSEWTKDSQTIVIEDQVRNLSKLDIDYGELDALSGLEAENLQLTERIFGLEIVLRHLTDEKASTRLVLENSEILAINLQAEIRRLETKIEAQKVNMKRKEESLQKQYLEIQEECNCLKEANFKLEAANENVIEESKILQKANGELRMQNLELYKHCTVLELEQRESRKLFSDILKQVEDLQHRFTSLLEETSLKEKIINADLDALLQENKKHKERLILEESLLTQMYMEKTVEVGSLQREVVHLRDQMSSSLDPEQRTTSDIVLVVNGLCADKAMLEAALQEGQEKVKLYETKLNSLQEEHEAKVQKLTDELAVTRVNHETLMVNHKKVVFLLESVKLNEEKLKSIVRGLELELKASEFEKAQLTGEISNLKVQLQKLDMLQDEILFQEKSLNEANFEYRRLETSHQVLCAAYEELEAENKSYVQRISSTEKVRSELEDYKRSKVELEEKVLRLEWDLIAREASCLNTAQSRYKLGQMCRENGELRRRMQILQEEKENCLEKVMALEEELKQERFLSCCDK